MYCQSIKKLLTLSLLLMLGSTIIIHTYERETTTKRYVRRRNDRGRKATTGALLGGALGAGLGGAIGGGQGAAVGAVTGVATGAAVGASRGGEYEEYEVIEEPYEEDVNYVEVY